jgi:hypothetical protein
MQQGLCAHRRERGQRGKSGLAVAQKVTQPSGHETRSHADAITAARDDRQRMPPGIPLDEHGAPDLQLLVRPLGHAATEARTKSTFTWDFSVGKRLQNQLLTTRQY